MWTERALEVVKQFCILQLMVLKKEKVAINIVQCLSLYMTA